MMPRPSNVAGVHWNQLRLECKQHGGHIVIVAGLDSLADDAADICLREMRDAGLIVDRRRRFIPMDAARAMAQDGLDYDDLPF